MFSRRRCITTILIASATIAGRISGIRRRGGGQVSVGMGAAVDDEPEPLSLTQALHATLANGSVTPPTPGWTKLTFATVTGPGATINAQGNLLFSATGSATIGVALTAQMDSPGSAALGYAWDGGTPVALSGGVSITDANPVQLAGVLQAAQLRQTLALYILSTNTADPVNWTNGDVGVQWTLVFPADASAPDYSATPPMPIDPGGNVSPWPPVPTFGTVIPGEIRIKTAANNPYALALPTFRSPLIPLGTLFNTSAFPPFGATGFPYNATPPASLPFNRVPAFPALPP